MKAWIRLSRYKMKMVTGFLSGHCRPREQLRRIETEISVKRGREPYTIWCSKCTKVYEIWKCTSLMERRYLTLTTSCAALPKRVEAGGAFVDGEFPLLEEAGERGNRSLEVAGHFPPRPLILLLLPWHGKFLMEILMHKDN